MKKNKGFTLVELLVVIAIIGLLSVLIVPSLIKINGNINERLLDQKKEYITTAAELYASNNPDIFNGSDSVDVYVYQLIDSNYLETDTKLGKGACTSENNAGIEDYMIKNGCIINPNDSSHILNPDKITLTKKNVGVVGVYGLTSSSTVSGSEALVKKICNGFGSEYDGYFVTSNNTYEPCKCNNTGTALIKVSDSSVNPTSCILVSNKESGEINNWLKYGSSTANWRVIGLYMIDGKLSAKMITSSVVN